MHEQLPSAAELLVQLARENERQRIEIEALKIRIAELEKQLADKG